MPLRIFVSWLLLVTLCNTKVISANMQDLTSREQLWIDSHPEITVAIMDAWPPLNSADGKGGVKGIGVDYIKLLGRRLRIDFKIIPGPFADNLKAVKEKKIDALMDVTPKPDRELFLNFTQPYIEVPHVIVARSDGPFYKNEEDLPGKTLALERGFGNVKYFVENYPDVKVVEYPDTAACLKAVSSGKAQAYAGNRAVITYIIAKELLTNLQVQGELHKKGSILAIGVRKDWPEMASILDKALSSITETEKLEVIGKWVGQDRYERIELTEDEKKWIGSHPLIRYMGKTDWLPFEVFEKNGEYTGIVADHLQLIENRIGISFKKITPEQQHESIKKILASESDIILADDNGDIIGDKLNFTKPFLSSPVVVVMKNREKFITDLNQLKGKKIAVIQNFFYSNELRTLYPDLSFTVVDSIDAGLKGVSTGKLNALLCPLASATYNIAELGYYDLQVAGKTDAKMDLAFAVRPDWEKFKGILNKAIASISRQDHQEIMNHYVKEQIINTGLAFKTVLKWILPVIIVLLLIIVLTIFYNRKLRQEVLERKRAQLKALGNEQKIKAMGQAMADALVMIDSLGRVMFWNQAAEKLFGYSVEEAIGKDFHDMAAPPEVREKAHTGIRQFAISGQGAVFGATISTVATNRTGEIFPVEVSLSSFQVENEWFAVGSVRDISDRKRAEEAMKESEKRFRGYFEHSQIGMAVTHPKKGWIEANGRLQEMLGYTLEELRQSTWAALTYPEDLEADVAFFEQMLAGEIDNYAMDKRFIRRDGEILYTNMSVSCLRNTNRSVNLVLASFLDITGRKQNEKQMKEQMEDLKQFSRLTINREERMIELKKEINNLMEQLGKKAKYKIVG